MPLVTSMLVLSLWTRRGVWYSVSKEGANGGLGDGCLRTRTLMPRTCWGPLWSLVSHSWSNRRVTQERAGAEEGVAGPGSKGEEAEKKGEATTQDCIMAAAVYLSHTAVILTKRSSSRPCGVRLESPNLSAALPNVVAYGGSRLHIASVVMTVYMPCSS